MFDVKTEGNLVNITEIKSIQNQSALISDSELYFIDHTQAQFDITNLRVTKVPKLSDIT